MEDKGWQFEAKGKFMVPKSFKVNLVHTMSLKTEGVLSLEVLRTERMFVRFEIKCQHPVDITPNRPRITSLHWKNCEAE